MHPIVYLNATTTIQCQNVERFHQLVIRLFTVSLIANDWMPICANTCLFRVCDCLGLEKNMPRGKRSELHLSNMIGSLDVGDLTHNDIAIFHWAPYS